MWLKIDGEFWRWQAIDYARLSHSTVSFFDYTKREAVTSRWNRITLNASKVFIYLCTSLSLLFNFSYKERKEFRREQLIYCNMMVVFVWNFLAK